MVKKKKTKKRKINWKKRFSNKLFLTSLVSTILLLITQLGIFPIPPDFEAIINSILTLLALGGVLTDPTTDGMWDSDLGASDESYNDAQDAMNENAGRKIAELNGLEDKLSELGMSEYFDYAEYGRRQLLNYPADSSYSIDEESKG
jgi:phi LC3 family holin